MPSAHKWDSSHVASLAKVSSVIKAMSIVIKPHRLLKCTDVFGDSKVILIRIWRQEAAASVLFSISWTRAPAKLLSTGTWVSCTNRNTDSLFDRQFLTCYSYAKISRVRSVVGAAHVLIFTVSSWIICSLESAAVFVVCYSSSGLRIAVAGFR